MIYRKKPLAIEAIQYNGTKKSFEAIKKEFGNPEAMKLLVGSESRLIFDITTPEGHHEVSNGDYVIKGIKGEFYPCKPDIFHLTYEPIKYNVDKICYNCAWYRKVEDRCALPENTGKDFNNCEDWQSDRKDED